MEKYDARYRDKTQEIRYKNGLCIYCGKQPFIEEKKACRVCREKKLKRQRKYTKNNRIRINTYNKKIRKDVIDKYGGRCVCCSENRWEFLAIDHINNDGGKERIEKYGTTKGYNTMWLPELKRTPVRMDLQILCHNCNMAKAAYGICPHNKNYVPVDFSILETNRQGNTSFNLNNRFEWPTDEKLLQLVNTYDCANVAKAIGVSDAAFRWRLKRRGLYDNVKKNVGGKFKFNSEDVISAYKASLN